jgi:WD40 repeat protein
MLICFDQRNGSGCGAENKTSAKFCRHCGRPLRFALQLLDPHIVIDHYEIARVIGYGGFGAVYEARMTHRPEVRVAIKESFDSHSVHAFQGEFELLRELQHDHLPRYYEMFEANGNGYLVMELIPGQSLLDVLNKHKGPLPEAQVLGYAVQICDVLHYLHSQQPSIIHRDIKPANVRLTPEGLVKLVDFGLLKQGSDTTGNSRRGLTPDYAPPEQWGIGDEHTDPRSDIYSLGTTLYHLFSGRKPPSVATRLAKSITLNPSPQEHNPRLSPHIAEAIVTAMRLPLEQRFPDVASFKLALLGMAPADTAATRTAQGALAAAARAGMHDQMAARSNAPVAPKHSSAEPAQESVQERNSITPDHIRQKRRGLGIRFLTPQQISNVNLQRTLQGHSNWIHSVAWSPDGKILATGSRDTTVRLWQASDGVSLKTLQGHSDGVTGVAWRHDGKILASGSRDNSVVLWRVSNGEQLGRLMRHKYHITEIAWSPDGEMMASASVDYTVLLWDMKTGRVVRSLAHKAQVYAVAWNPDGDVLATGSSDDVIRLWNTSDGSLLTTLRQEQNEEAETEQLEHGATRTSNIGGLLKSGSGGLRPAGSRQLTYAVYSVAWSPDGQTLASGSTDGTVRFWRVSDSSLLHISRGHEGSIFHVDWSPDGQTLASGSTDGTVRFWRRTDGALLHTFYDYTATVSSVAWSPNGQLLASGSRDHKVRLWQIVYG